MTVELGKKIWYYYLVPNENKRSLLNEHKIKKDNLIISLTTPKDIKLYTLFNDYVEFYEYQLNFRIEHRSFYEVIMGNKLQKPHFDLDFGEDYQYDIDNIFDMLIENFIKYIPTLNLEKDIQIYSSHGKTKKSYHIVINNYCHQDHLNAKAFYDLITENLPPNHCIDRAVYSKTQQFRILGSQKIGSGRIKKLEMKWKFHGREINHIITNHINMDENLLLLNNSLVSVTDMCTILPLFYKKEEKIINNFTSIDYDVDEIMEMCIKMDDGEECYSIKDIKDNLIILFREKASFCHVCKRIHEKEHPFITVTNAGAFFNCRRNNENKSYFIGKLHSNDSTELNEENKSNEEYKSNELNKSNKEHKSIKSNELSKEHKLIKSNELNKKQPKVGKNLLKDMGILKDNKDKKGIIASIFMEI